MEITQIGKYQITGELGRGAMGEVYKAHDPVLNREVAIKTISASLGSDSDLRKRFHREAQAAARLNHPNIITVYEYGEEQGKIYIAMELLEGSDLKDHIGTETLKGLDDKLDVMEQICDGLAFAHSREIIHRDLKPGNIHLQPNGQVKILDFGLAKLGHSEMTQAGMVMGTPNYMSPEQVMGEKVDVRTDVFALGAIFYELLAEKKPFDGDSAHAVLFQVVHKEPPPIAEVAPGIPAILVEIIEKAMKKNRDERFSTAAEVREALSLVRRALESGRAATASLESEGVLAVAEGKPATGGYRRQSGPKSKPPSSPPGPVDATIAHGPDADATEDIGPIRSTPPAPPPSPSRAPLYVGGALALAGIAVAAALLLRQPEQRPAPPPDTSSQVTALTEALVSTQVELARRDLDDKNFRNAVAQAQRALKLVPDSADAKAILTQAQGQLDALEAAAGEARSAFEAGDIPKSTEALSRVLALDPKHPVAAELSGKLNKYFRKQAEDARQAMVASRGQAEKTKAETSEAFNQAGKLAKEADTFFARGEFAEATRGFLEARDGFDRARRAVEAKPLPTPPPTQAPPPTTETVASTTLPLPPSTAPVATLPPVTVPPVTAPPVPRRPFNVSFQTVIEAAGKKGGLAGGFDTSDVKVKNPDFVCQVVLEPTPAEVRPGDAYTVKVYLANDGTKPIKLKALGLQATTNGTKAARPANLVAKEVAPKNRELVGELSGTWPEGVTAWTLEASVTSAKDDVARNKITWRAN